MSASTRCAVFLVALLGSNAAAAICVPDKLYVRYVGDKANDSQCTDDDIQSAIDNATCPSTIFITDEHTYTAQHLDIENKNLTLVGTTATCGPQACDGGCVAPTTPQLTIDGAGHSGDSVMYIHGASNVTLKYLKISNGDNIVGPAPTYGGGIHFDGAGTLTLDTVTIDNNTAQFGGGVNLSGTSGFASLTLLSNTQIIGNTAVNSGGGIRITGNAFASMLYDKTLIANNHAPNGYGGGINIVGPAHADIASPGLGLGVIYNNDAEFGGGVAATSSDGGTAEVQIFSADPTRATRLQGNFASAKGGAIYLKGYIDSSNYNRGSACLHDFLIDGNSAPEGSAIYADHDSSLGSDFGTDVQLNGDSRFCRGLPASAKTCAAGITCNEISDNAAIDAGGNPTLGAAVQIGSNAYFESNRFAMRRNEGGYAVYDTGSIGTVMSNCLLVDNDVTRNLVFSNTDDVFSVIDSCTFAGNAILSTDTIHAEEGLTLSNTIIDQPGNLALAYSGDANDLHISYVLSNDVSTLPNAQGATVGRPTYVNAAAGDYHLSLRSLAVDFAPQLSDDGRDLDGRFRDIDLPNVNNVYGYRDLGPYERSITCGVSDTIFCDGFED